MSVTTNLHTIKSTIPSGVELIAVSKTYPTDVIKEAYTTGQRVFGESRPQELAEKYEELPKDVEWHFIGHLQTNKVKQIVPFVRLIHSVDSVRLYNEIIKEATKINRTVNCLLQVHIANEDTKFGFTPDELISFLNSRNKSPHLQICGLMGMATYTDNEQQVLSEFRNLHNIFTNLKANYFANNSEFKEISMGMSGDYLLAIKEGATMVRVGSSIFGERTYISKN